jgi:hypothetical protein
MMRVAIIDAHGKPIAAWDTARLARHALASSAVAEAGKRGLLGRRKALTAEDLAGAIDDALDELLRDVARR